MIVIDPDVIARRINPANPSRAAVVAARQAIMRCRSLLALRESFVLESTLAGKGAISIVRKSKQAGYRALLIYVALGDPELHIERVRLRVSEVAMMSQTRTSGEDTGVVYCVLRKQSC